MSSYEGPVHDSQSSILVDWITHGDPCVSPDGVRIGQRLHGCSDTLWENDPNKLMELIEADAFVAPASEPVEERPAPPPRRVEKPHPPVVGLSGHSMTGTSVSTTVVVGASGAGLAMAKVDIPRSVARRLPIEEAWLFIPHRFLDGVFRPPQVVSSV